MQQLLNRPRLLFGLAASGCLLLMLIALFFEHGLGLQPCPLCHIQRGIVVLFGLFCMIACLHNPGKTGRKLYASLLVLVSASGMATAARQVWLQHLPKDQVPACLPSLEFMVEAFPIQDVFLMLMEGSADCAEVNWTLFGLSIAEMTLMSFTLMLLWSLFMLFKRFPRPSIFK